MDSDQVKNSILLASALGVLILIVIQILTADTSTKTETAMFSILQFLFSIWFAWHLSLRSSERNFLESQKKFAIAAFRRIKEIERAISRAQKFVLSNSDNKKQPSGDTQALIVSLMSAQDAVNSSIADWGDVIGNEIHVAAELEKLKNLRRSSDTFERDYLDNLRRQNEIVESSILPRISELQETLPEIMQFDAATEKEPQEIAIKKLIKTLNENDSLVFDGFWDSQDSFSSSPAELIVGQDVFIAKGFTTDRPNTLLAYKQDSSWFGVITNPFADDGLGYDEFVDIIEYTLALNLLPKQFGGEMVKCKLISIDEVDNESGMQWFQIELLAIARRLG